MTGGDGGDPGRGGAVFGDGAAAGGGGGRDDPAHPRQEDGEDEGPRGGDSTVPAREGADRGVPIGPRRLGSRPVGGSRHPRQVRVEGALRFQSRVRQGGPDSVQPQERAVRALLLGRRGYSRRRRAKGAFFGFY